MIFFLGRSVSRKIFVFLATVSVAAFLEGCLGADKESKTRLSFSQSDQTAGKGGDGGGGPPADTDDRSGCPRSFCLGEVAKQSVNLGAMQQFQMSIKAGKNFNGNVRLETAAEELNALDPPGVRSVRFKIEPPAVRLAPNSTSTFSVTVIADTRAPSYDDHFHVSAVDSASPQGYRINQTVLLQIFPVLEIRLQGGTDGTETWGSPVLSLVRTHPQNMTVRWLNYDTNSTHAIHGNAPIPHQTGNMAPAPSLSAPGGIYEYEYVRSSPVLANGTYYCHEHETSNEQRTLSFNTPANGLFPTYARINDSIFRKKCANCHSGSSPDGNISLDSYASTVAALDAVGEAAFIRSVDTGGSMPRTGRRLTEQEVEYIREWAAAGRPQQ